MFTLAKSAQSFWGSITRNIFAINCNSSRKWRQIIQFESFQLKIMCNSGTYLKLTYDFSCKNHFELIIIRPIQHKIYPKFCWISWRCLTLPTSFDIRVVQRCVVPLQYPYYHMNRVTQKGFLGCFLSKFIFLFSQCTFFKISLYNFWRIAVKQAFYGVLNMAY